MSNSNIQTLTLGMGCFWSTDALFGQITGIIRTCVGFAGGTKDNPTYEQLGDQTETVEMDFDFWYREFRNHIGCVLEQP
ncbi:peptide-methionine (S)-S-oxide reductase [Paenibacillus sp. Soil724D2]|uniref:peptide-methionine (S)-S-oxide reductase n=1 Tax=Paenibacillus sp. (strain Soil724D2) TaxID=1736392 RepID=UPI000AB009BB|nr:peptide-methionine (S)-S-oxide reductase [Paenibacillus sp. Soil724D2]